MMATITKPITPITIIIWNQHRNIMVSIIIFKIFQMKIRGLGYYIYSAFKRFVAVNLVPKVFLSLLPELPFPFLGNIIFMVKKYLTRFAPTRFDSETPHNFYNLGYYKRCFRIKCSTSLRFIVGPDVYNCII